MPTKFLAPLGDRIELGLYYIDRVLRFQACDDVSEMPQTIRFQLPLNMEAGIPPAPQRAE
jgi:hypothetical protein